jgi:DNA-directed RNA polymerase omega subunit
MPSPFSVDDFADKIDSLYRLVIVGSLRANQLRTETHGFAGVSRDKPTMVALEEILAGKVGWTTTDDEDEHILSDEE